MNFGKILYCAAPQKNGSGSYHKNRKSQRADFS